MVPEELRKKYTAWGQTHVFKYIDSPELREKYGISDSDVSEFINQLESVDFPRVKALLAQAKADTAETGSAEFSAPGDDEIFMIDGRPKAQASEWWERGLTAIKGGKVAVCILSGGQGTRMGLAADESKGMLRLDTLLSKPYVFELFVKRLLRLRLTSGSESLPLLIMTSPINNKKVSGFLRSHNFFGYPEKDVIIFKQGTLPALTSAGDLLLEGHARLAISPDGNGGIYNSLLSEGVFAQLEQRGVESLHVIAVDNAIARPADPLFVGACLEAQAEVGNKVVWKCDWKEKVGVIAKRNGRTSVVEYSDLYNPELGIDNPLIRATNSEGRLLFGAGNICNHYYSLGGLKRMLPKVTAHYHLAVKKIQSVDPESGEIVKPKANNGLKLESFIFDAFELAESSIIVEAERGGEFTPMKNALGDDSPETAVAQIYASHRKWLTAAGAFVPEDTVVEISPLVSYSGEGLEKLKGFHFPKTSHVLVDQSFINSISH
jgi:UDP-N-acetylglucosamine/UDP-N-acetylgalactosamine diphosphorylase